MKSRKVMKRGGGGWWRRVFSDNNKKSTLSEPLLPVLSQQMNGNIELGNIKLGNIELYNYPIKTVNNEAQTTTLPIEYTVESGKLSDGKSSKIHISKINHTPKIPPIILIVDENNTVSSGSYSTPLLSINEVNYIPVRIIPTALV